MQSKVEEKTTKLPKKTINNSTGVDFHNEGKRSVNQQKPPTRTALICPDLHRSYQKRSPEVRLDEFIGLANAIRLEVVFSEISKLRLVRPATYLGGGYVDQLSEQIKEHNIELVLVDASLSPVQQRNLETRLGAKILDRTALILEIFGERAATREGVLQVELAHLNYQKGRLVRSWTHLERQRGGGGFTGGPGETQIESDRRQIQDRIVKLERKLEKIAKTRQLQRAPRDAVPYPIVALVGYTNAGKSSIFNIITKAGVKAQNLLFATLDTTVRRATLPHGRDIMLSDTVGFIADLPTDLVAAFRATLEEVIQADIILHVRDIASKDHVAQASDVLSVLSDLGVNPETTPIIEVWNKVDILQKQQVKDKDMGDPLDGIKPLGKVESYVGVSALSGQGIDELLAQIEACLAKSSRSFEILVPHENSKDIGWIYSHSEVLEQREPDEIGTVFIVRVQPRYNLAFQSRFENRLTAA
jgi:GTP-binding protein HflX